MVLHQLERSGHRGRGKHRRPHPPASRLYSPLRQGSTPHDSASAEPSCRGTCCRWQLAEQFIPNRRQLPDCRPERGNQRAASARAAFLASVASRTQTQVPDSLMVFRKRLRFPLALPSFSWTYGQLPTIANHAQRTKKTDREIPKKIGLLHVQARAPFASYAELREGQQFGPKPLRPPGDRLFGPQKVDSVSLRYCSCFDAEAPALHPLRPHDDQRG
jgi:hypothetical protein